MIQRDEQGIAHIVGLSGGKDSVALALALRDREPRPYTYIYTPTGNELPEMELHLQVVEKLLGQPILRLTNGTLAGVIAREKMIPNFRSRWCTRILKLVPANQFYKEAHPSIAYVGLRADESERQGMQDSDAAQDFPFMRWGWGIDEVLACNASHGISIPERTDCAWCFFQKLGEWFNLWERHPEIYAEGEAIELEFGHTFRSPGRDTWPASLKDLRERFESGDIPERSLNMMAKRNGMCRACTL